MMVTRESARPAPMAQRPAPARAEPGLPRAMRPARAAAATTILPEREGPARGFYGAGTVAVIDLHDGLLPAEGSGLIVGALRAAGHRVRLARPSRAGAEPALWRRPLRLLARPATGAALLPAGDRPDLLVISAPPAARAEAARIAEAAAGRGVPVLLDGSAGGAEAGWRGLPGLFAILGPGGGLEVQAQVGKVGGMRYASALGTGERLLALCQLAQAALSGAPACLADYDDFSWRGARVVPLRAGDRPIAALMCEMVEQARRHETAQFFFRDAALNARPERLREIGAELPRWLQGAEWAGRVEIGAGRLARAELKAAVAGGLRRLGMTLPDLDAPDAAPLAAAAAEALAQAAEAGVRLHLRLAAAGPATLDLVAAQAGRIHRLHLEAEAPAPARTLARRINAAPESRAGRAFAELF